MWIQLLMHVATRCDLPLHIGYVRSHSPNVSRILCDKPRPAIRRRQVIVRAARSMQANEHDNVDGRWRNARQVDPLVAAFRRHAFLLAWASVLH